MAFESSSPARAKRMLFAFPARGLSLLVAAICVLPMVAVLVAALSGGTETLQHLAETRLWHFTANTLLLVVIVGLGTAVVGTGAAWLVTMCRFPGVRWLEIALALPLAFPAYVMAYAYTDILDHPGIVQTTLRDLTGWGPRDYWFPEIRSLGGAALMLIMVLYPYVYLLARAAFLQQSATSFFAARTLGHSTWTTFFRINLPLARPAIAGGVLLAIMETIADFGTVSYFAIQTYTTGIYQSWFAMADRAAAAQLALGLLSFALLLAILERQQRGAAKQYTGHGRYNTLPRMRLTGWKAMAATTACAVPVIFGFALPTVVLFVMGLGSEQDLTSSRYIRFIQNSVTLAGTAAIVTVVGAVLLAFVSRLQPGRLIFGAREISRIGYAVPGGVIAVGLLVPFAAFDNAVDAFMETNFGIDTGLLLTGSIWLLVMAYMVRFMAVALNTYESGLSTIHPHVDAVTRTLGRTPAGMLRAVHFPILTPSLLTAGLIVFIDVMKELPATMIMRPFNFDTLAVQAHRLASDERLEGAAVPSLVIVALGMLPVILVCRGIGRQRST